MKFLPNVSFNREISQNISARCYARLRRYSGLMVTTRFPDDSILVRCHWKALVKLIPKYIHVDICDLPSDLHRVNNETDAMFYLVQVKGKVTDINMRIFLETA